jgi:hypothetical protein
MKMAEKVITCNTKGGNQKCTQNIDVKRSREDINCQDLLEMEIYY